VCSKLKLLAEAYRRGEKVKRLMKHYWTKACQYDGIDPASKFVVWSLGNPWTPKVNRATGLFFSIKRRVDAL
jgi:hypothetical protein